MPFPIQDRIEVLEQRNKSIDMMLQTQLYAMPFKGHDITFKWSLAANQLHIQCPQLSVYINKMSVQYDNEIVVYEPSDGVVQSKFVIKRASQPRSITLELSTGTMAMPTGLLKVFIQRTVGHVCVSPAYIQSLIIQYAVTHKLFNDNVIHCDANLQKIFKREFLNLDTLDEKVFGMCQAIPPIVLALEGDSDSILDSYRSIHNSLPCQGNICANERHI